MAMLHLTEAQWLLGLAIVIALVLQCMILTALIDLKRKGIEPDAANAGIALWLAIERHWPGVPKHVGSSEHSTIELHGRG
jgi:hypothetical protein